MPTRTGSGWLVGQRKGGLKSELSCGVEMTARGIIINRYRGTYTIYIELHLATE